MNFDIWNYILNWIYYHWFQTECSLKALVYSVINTNASRGRGVGGRLYGFWQHLLDFLHSQNDGRSIRGRRPLLCEVLRRVLTESIKRCSLSIRIAVAVPGRRSSAAADGPHHECFCMSPYAFLRLQLLQKLSIIFFGFKDV